MNKNIVKGNKNTVMKQIKQNWGELSAEEIDQIIDDYEKRLIKKIKQIKAYNEKARYLNH